MAFNPATRSRLNWANGTTVAGLALARAARCRRQSGPNGTIIAGHYRLAVPAAVCFVVGDVIFCRESAHWLLAAEQRPVLRHEFRHTEQYALLGPLFWPLYAASCAWSYALTGHYGSRNAFERAAGLTDGGYSDRPVRPALHALVSRS